MADSIVFDELLKRAAAEHPEALSQVAPAAAPSKPSTKLAMLAYLGGLAGDVGTTAYGSATGKTVEANPLMKGGAPTVAATSLGTMLLLRKLLGDKHPTALRNILYGMGGAHGAAAVSNLHQMSLTQPPAPEPPPVTPTEYINPDYFPTLGK